MSAILALAQGDRDLIYNCVGLLVVAIICWALFR